MSAPESTEGERRTVEDVVAGWSLKRLAWAYGCSKAGSDRERNLARLLRRRVKDEIRTEKLRRDC